MLLLQKHLKVRLHVLYFDVVHFFTCLPRLNIHHESDTAASRLGLGRLLQLILKFDDVAEVLGRRLLAGHIIRLETIFRVQVRHTVGVVSFFKTGHIIPVNVR